MPQGDVRTRALLEGMRRIGYQVVNVGERDIRLGWESFVSRTREAKLAFVSSNIVDKASHKPVFDPYTVVEAASPDGSQRMRVGVIGVVRFNPIFAKPGPDGGPLAIIHPTEPVRAAVTALEAQEVDLTVLLSAMHRDDSARIAREIPGIDFVLGSYGGLYTATAEKQGDTVLIYSGNQGKRVGEARVFLTADGRVSDVQSTLHLLGNRYPGVPEMLQFVDAAHEEATAAGTRPGGGSPAPGGQAASRFVGSQACRPCHAEAYAQWNGTAHARALQHLDPDPHGDAAACHTCHAIAPAGRNTFSDPRPDAQAGPAGCETCHGPGQAHSGSPELAYGKVTVASCAACHTPRHSPGFDYYTYLARITHQENAQGSR